MSSDSSSPRLPSGLVWLMAAAAGLAVASNYYAQPLLHMLAADLGLRTAQAGVLVTVAQIGYAAGLLLLVPLGDLVERRKLVVGMTLLTACGLLVSALAGNAAQLLAGTAVAGVFSVAAQVLVPFAAALAAPHERGRVIGMLLGGMLLGVLLARTFAGTVAAVAGWRMVYGCAAVAMFALACVLRRALPAHPPAAAAVSYAGLIGSIGRLFLEEPALRLRGLLGGLIFAGFAMLWTALAFLLSAEPFHYSTFAIGLFGLLGAAGALAAAPVGRLLDRGKGDAVMGAGLLCMLASWLPLALGQASIALLALGIVALDVAAHALHVGNQNAVYQIRPDARSRLAAAYMTCYFLGGAAGSAVSAWAYARGGWGLVAAAGAACAACAMGVWAMRPRRGSLRVPAA
ncbi:Inner membrane transport protein YnfM [Pigmentiphaga humi]|uniref:Inner membrane transport protein YnfM n=1 Tax=Pigmentiphaga humi TaxID=2478468 RepID=A0A3P4AWK2_9BURK|nr:MFS transporter [Pigmentiphaga humi]VCU68434.1 Inner membrane transport protein YnfM [Pigmentiphaga humi]